MKKYIAVAVAGNGNFANSTGVKTRQEAAEWAKGWAAKNNGKAFVCEVLDVAERPAPVVILSPYTTEENLTINHS